MDLLDRLDMLTPADFALVRRRVALTGGAPDRATLLRLLSDECEGRTGRPPQTGFITWPGR